MLIFFQHKIKLEVNFTVYFQIYISSAERTKALRMHWQRDALRHHSLPVHPSVGFRGAFILGFGLALETSVVAEVSKGMTCNIRSQFHSTELFSYDNFFPETPILSPSFI